MSTIQLRAMTIDDYDPVIQLWRATAGVGLNESDEREPIARYLRDNPGLSTVAVEPDVDGNERIVGAMLCLHNGRRAEFVHLAVAASHRGRGIGRRIAEHCLALLAEQGVPRCNIYVYTENDRALAFWHRVGFAPRPDVVFLQGSTTLLSPVEDLQDPTDGGN